MTSQSIYTECVNLSPDHVAWLDGCGAKWGSGDRLSELKSYTRVEFMCVDDTWYFMSTHNNSFTHIPTGSEFCEQVAEILGIDKPRFGKSLDEDCMSVKMIWNKSDIEPMPSEPGVLADQYLCIDLSDNYKLFTYIYEIHEWTQYGGDKQLIKYWAKLPRIPNEPT